MPILAVDEHTGTFTHCCGCWGCTCTRAGMALDPACADLCVLDGCIALSACPECGSVELLRTTISAAEAGEDEAPGSLVGSVDPETRGLVIAHHVGDHPLAARRLQAQRIRQMLRHAHLAPHLQAQEQKQQPHLQVPQVHGEQKEVAG